MQNRDKIVEHLRGKLEARNDIHAFWVEGSGPQGHADELSDIDLWVSTDDDKIFTIYNDIEQILSEIAPIDFRYVVKNKGELGQNVYPLIHPRSAPPVVCSTPFSFANCNELV